MPTLRPDPTELGRLALMQRYPLHYVHRRTERIDLTNTHHYAVTVTQQFTVPLYGPTAASANTVRELIIPLGQIPKDRLPDLCVTGPDGCRLPVLGRAARGEIVTTLFTSQWKDKLLPDTPETDTQLLWGVVELAIAQVVRSSREGANVTIFRLRSFLQECAQISGQPGELAHRLLKEDPFWIEVLSLERSRLVMVRFQGIPGWTYVITATYTERFGDDTYPKAGFFGRPRLRPALRWLGLITMPVSRSVANVGQAAFLWIIQTAPHGVEIVRFFWEDKRNTSPAEDSISVETTRAVLSHAAGSQTATTKKDSVLDLQIAASPAVMATIVLAAILLYVSRYIYQGVPSLSDDHNLIATFLATLGFHTATSVDNERAILVALGGVFAGIPAAIAGAFAYKEEVFARYASRGPRILLTILSGLAALLAVAVALKGLSKLTEVAAYALSVYATFVLGIFFYIGFGFRWRKNEGSRWPTKTRATSPERCLQRQSRWATGFLGLLLLGVMVYARSLYVLHSDQFFSESFPANIWHAWWSLFGL